MPYPELSAILTDIGTEAAEMFQNYPKLWLLVLENKEHQLLKITDAPIK